LFFFYDLVRFLLVVVSKIHEKHLFDYLIDFFKKISCNLHFNEKN